MDRYSDQLYELKFPKDFAQKQRDRMAQYRKENFKNIIRKTPFVEFYAMSPWSSEELETIGIQWFSGINFPFKMDWLPEPSLLANTQFSFHVQKQKVVFNSSR